MNSKQAKQLKLVGYLEHLNIHPKIISKKDYYYLSPLHTESNPSFHVDDEHNLWYDHGGDAGGGTIIDFGIKFHGCTVSIFLEMLDQYVHSKRVPNIVRVPNDNPIKNKKKEKKIKVVSTGPITSLPLLYYLQYRKIPAELAELFCCEVRYELYERFYYAIGFKNDLGGYELRNSKFKGSSQPKGITFIDRGFKTVEVIEGFISFLSFLTIVKEWRQLQSNFLILNTIAFFEKCQELMEKHELIRLHLDRDLQGFLRTSKAKIKSSKYQNASSPYMGYKDWNEYLIVIHNSPGVQEKNETHCYTHPTQIIPVKTKLYLISAVRQIA